MAEGLAFRARYRLLHGDFDGALKDKLTCLRLGRMLMKDSAMLIDQLRGHQIEEVGNSIPHSASLNAPAPREILLSLRELPREPNRLKYFKHTLETSEFWTQLDQIQIFSHADLEVLEFLIEDGWFLTAVKHLGLDWNRTAIRLQQLYREYVENSVNQKRLLETSEGLETALKPEPSLLRCLTRRGRSEELAGTLAAFSPGIRAGKLIFRKEMTESLTRIGCALQLYRLEHDGQFPSAFTRNEEGTALHSWRVLILPYLGEAEKALYEKIRLDEPWDSQWNRQFHAQMPEVYRTPNPKTSLSPEFPEEAQTRFSVILGENGLFNDSGVGVDSAQRMDGIAGSGSGESAGPKRNAARMALVTEREMAKCWMDPAGELRAEEILEEFAYLPEENAIPPQRVPLFLFGDTSAVMLESEKELRLWAVGEEIFDTEEISE